MTTPGLNNTSQTARLMIDAPSYAVGWQEPRYLVSPPAGQPWSYTVDGRYYERVLAVSFVLNTSAVVANRFPVVELTDTNGTVITSVLAGNNVPASTSLGVFLTLHGPGYASGSAGSTFGFLPDLLIPPGWTWKSFTFGLDAGDQFSGIVLLVQKFPNDAVAITAGE